MLIPLLKSAARTDSALPVEVIYFQPGSPFIKTGEFQIDLPVIDIPIMHFMYSLYIPEKLVLYSFSENLEKVDNSTILSEVAQKPAAKEGEKMKRPSISQTEIYFEQQARLERNISGRGGIVFTHDEKSDIGTGGFLPLRIYIPTTGKLLRFEKKLAMDENIF